MKMKKFIALGLSLALTVGTLAGCGSTGGAADAGTSDKADTSASKEEAKADAGASGKVYYLNFKPEQDPQWQTLAASYTQQTGVPVTVVTAASGEYETTLMSEMAKSDAPTLFQVNGPVGLANWKDYCYDLSGSAIANELTSDAFALKDGDATLSLCVQYGSSFPDGHVHTRQYGRPSASEYTVQYLHHLSGIWRGTGGIHVFRFCALDSA